MKIIKRIVCLIVLWQIPIVGTPAQPSALVEAGRSVFADETLSDDRKVSCQSCHDPHHAYADPRPRSIGSNLRTGTRNAPSLVGVGEDSSFFWDGRRARLEDAVLDPFTNPVELGLSSTELALQRMRDEPAMMKKFRAAFPLAKVIPTEKQLQEVLCAFVRSLHTGYSPFDRALSERKALNADAEQGRQTFIGSAGCTQCHGLDSSVRLTDENAHASGIEQRVVASRLPSLARDVVENNLPVDKLGPKVLSDADWSALGRFTVSHRPADIGAFRTPSLRNVALTAPYMHDGSIATLEDAVDYEIYYHLGGRGHAVNLSVAERRSIVAFLRTLTDDSSNLTAARQSDE